MSNEALRRLVAAESRDGQLLAANIEDNLICSLSVDRGIPCVLLVWKHYVTGAQLRFIHESMLELMKRDRLSKLLSDDTDLPTVHGEDQQWITGNWMPRAVAAGLRFVANKRPQACFGELAIGAIMAAAPSGLTIRSFPDIEVARRWLGEM